MIYTSRFLLDKQENKEKYLTYVKKLGLKALFFNKNGLFVFCCVNKNKTDKDILDKFVYCVLKRSGIFLMYSHVWMNSFSDIKVDLVEKNKVTSVDRLIDKGDNKYCKECPSKINFELNNAFSSDGEGCDPIAECLDKEYIDSVSNNIFYKKIRKKEDKFHTKVFSLCFYGARFSSLYKNCGFSEFSVLLVHRNYLFHTLLIRAKNRVKIVEELKKNEFTFSVNDKQFNEVKIANNENCFIIEDWMNSLNDGFICSDYPDSQEPKGLKIKNKLTTKTRVWYKSNPQDVNKFLRRNLYLDEIKVTRR